jgi:diguanylate cyclase (GGDEF)-like protein
MVLIIASGSIVFSYLTSSNQIDDVYKSITIANAKHFAISVDGDYVRELRKLLETDEFQEIRNKAEQENNDSLIQNYLEEKNMWTRYTILRQNLDRYIATMDEVKYVYIVAHGDANAVQDMYLVDDSEQTLYDSAGRWEDREEEYLGKDLIEAEPSISYSDEWGWLVSYFAPVYDSRGNCVCIVGCDVEYKDIIAAKNIYLTYDIIGIVALASIVMLISLYIVNKNIISPLKLIATDVKKFKPNKDSLNSGILSLGMDEREDEIGQIYNSIRGNQLDIVDYIKSISSMKENLTEKDTEISKLSTQSLKDPLTSVGNRNAYNQKLQELQDNYSIIIVDLNNLKEINDNCGHKFGDRFIKNCSKLICDTFKHSSIYRYGGDEFIIIPEGEDYDNRYQRLRELEDAFDTSYLKETNKPWERLTASCGIADKTKQDTSVEQVFSRADKEMYKNKSKFKETFGSYR